MKINFRKYLLEQTEWQELTASEKETVKGFADAKVAKYFKELSPPYKVKRNGTWKDSNGVERVKWQKKLMTTPPAPTSDLTKYEGKYNPNFTIKLKDGKLYGSGKISDKEFGDIELIPVSGNKFKATISGIDVEINFNESDGLITGGTATATILGFSNTTTFTKVSSTPPKPDKPDEPESDDTSVWSCIEKYNKENNARSLFKRDEYRYEKVDLEYDNNWTIFKYYEDGRVDWAYYSNQKPILQGKWECRGDNGYIIKWSNGKISTYNVKTGGGLDGNSNNTATNTSENLCPNGYKEGCVSEEDILNKKKALKVCSKCDLVKKVQENPEIKTRIFRLQKEAGQPEKTDNVFGPIMFAAIKEYQSSHGINPTGAVGEKTLSKINSYVNPKLEEPKVNNNEPVINKTDVKNEPVINKTDVKTTNKPQVKPIYRRSSRQVLSPDEEL
jgi:peptidoglycan hydrolase-like protein with peptidoglycan-binding domain